MSRICAFLCCGCCCGPPARPPKSRRALTDEDIEKLAHDEPRSPPPSYHPPSHSLVSIDASTANRSSATYTAITVHSAVQSSQRTITPHTTGATLPSYVDRTSTPSVSGDNQPHELADAQLWEAKPRPQSPSSTHQADRTEKDGEAEEERQATQPGRLVQTEAAPQGRRSEGDATRWDELDIPPPAYTPGGR